ncbi:MAG: hypothetical protein AABY64_00760 [Bdellovibrionota bacterium]
MKFIFIFFAMSYSAISSQAQELPYIDNQFACTNAAEANQMIADFKVNVSSFGGLELCNEKKDIKKLFNDLTIIKNGRFTNTGSNLFIRNFIASDRYYDWMKSMTRGMNRGNDIPAATAYNRSGHFTMQDGWTKLSTLGRVGTVLHEARHTANYAHTRCKHGPYMNTNSAGCDEDYAYGGSHAVEMEYYARVSVLGQNFHPVFKAMARLMAVARSNFVFNTSPIQTREALLAINSSNQGVLFDKQNVIQREVPNAKGTLKRTSYGAAIFTGPQAYSIEMYGKTGLPPLILDTYSYFKLLLSLDKQIKDFEEFDTNQKRYVVGLTEANKLVSFNFPLGEWNPEVDVNFTPHRSVTTVETGAQGYFLIDSNMDIYKYDISTKKLSAPLDFKWNPEYINIAKVDNHLFILKNDGKIYEKLASGNIELSRFPAANYSNLVSVPLYDGFEVTP